MILIKYFLKPIYISYIYLFVVYGSKNRHLNHKENERTGRKIKLQKLRMVVLHPRGQREREREIEGQIIRGG